MAQGLAEPAHPTEPSLRPVREGFPGAMAQTLLNPVHVHSCRKAIPMADMLVAPQSVSPVPPVPGRGKDPGTQDTSPDNMAAGASPSFAAVLKSRSETAPADSVKRNSAEEDVAANAGTITLAEDTSTVLNLLQADSPLDLRNLHQAALASNATAASLVKSSAGRNDSELFPPLPAESPEISLSLTASAAASSVVPIGLTPATQQAPNAAGVSAGLLRERGIVADKLAAKAAIAADTGATGKLQSIQEAGSGDFSDIMDRMTQNPTTNSLPSSPPAPASIDSGIETRNPAGTSRMAR